MNSFYLLFLGAFIVSAIASSAEEQLEGDKADFTLVNKHDLAERKKKWQMAVTEKAILAKENDKLTMAMKAKSEELEQEKSKLNSARQGIKKYRKLVDFIIYEQPRTWKSNKGKALQAILIEDDGSSVRLRTGLEAEVSIGRDGLSNRDITLLNLLRDIENDESLFEDESSLEESEDFSKQDTESFQGNKTDAFEEDRDAPEQNRPENEIEKSITNAL